MDVGRQAARRADALELQVFIVVSGRCALEVKFDFVRAAGGTSTHSYHLALSTVGPVLDDTPSKSGTSKPM
jgi:hypothetical protein